MDRIRHTQKIEHSRAQDTFYVGNMKGVARIYQQAFVDTYSKVAFAKLYDRKTLITDNRGRSAERPGGAVLRCLGN